MRFPGGLLPSTCGQIVTSNALKITNARENNLKDVSLELPHDTFTVVTGLSGSGKSSLAFDTVYAEGQRRYIETFSPYTRQFLDKVKRPDVDLVENVRPAIAIEQRTKVRTSRSTVGSLTDIDDYLKIIWANLAQPICPSCGIELLAWSPKKVAQYMQRLLLHHPGLTLMVAACFKVEPGKSERTKQRNFKAEIERLTILGASRLFNLSDGSTCSIDEGSAALLSSDSELVVVFDRVRADSFDLQRMHDAVEQAYQLADGSCLLIELGARHAARPYLQVLNDQAQRNLAQASFRLHRFTAAFACAQGSVKLARPRPALFSYNHPYGACPGCKGFGKVLRVDPALCVPNPTKSIRQGAIECWSGKAAKYEMRQLYKFCTARRISVDAPWGELSAEQRNLIFEHDTKEFYGIQPWFKWLERKAYKMHVRVFLSRYRGQFTCDVCNGTRLKPDASAYRIRGYALPQLWEWPILKLRDWLNSLRAELSSTGKISRELRDVFDASLKRLNYLCDLGLPYLTLGRQARTLSGGETQRVNLASAIGSGLISTQFVLDEPTVGLHARDTERLVQSLRALQRSGNSLLVVEHDLETIAAADHVIEMGPQAGSRGGQVQFNDTARKWTGITLPCSAELAQPQPIDQSAPKITITNASARNLRGFTVNIPLGRLVCLAGVSGSGKSTLVTEVISKGFEQHRLGIKNHAGCGVISGFDQIEELLLVDQSPLAKSPRGNIATYSGIWDTVRNLLAASPEAELRGLTKSSFSFNVDGGRCPACAGAGYIREDMQFLSDVYIPCEVCLGKRFQQTVLEVSYKGRNVDQLLHSTVTECVEIFSERPEVAQLARTLEQLGLGYLTLGHPLSELSGGEAQRLKLVPFVAKSTNSRAKRGSLLVFDEPTTGLHAHDVLRLIDLLRVLRDRGHTVLCVEHNLSVLLASDWLIDLGPEGGEYGGELVAQGTPMQLVQEQPKRSLTAKYLKQFAAQLDNQSKKASRFEPVAAPQMISPSELEVYGAREHNLKNISLKVPLGEIVAFTGVSGSGKSSIAKDIIFAEGQRRYLDCLSPYARQFIKELKKPDIDALVNIKPTICVAQHTYQPSELSTVGTMSDVYNFLRLLYAKVGIQHCPDHPKHAIAAQGPAEIAQAIKEGPRQQLRLLAPVVKLKKGIHREIFERAIKAEISEVRVDGVWGSPASFAEEGLARSKPHNIDLVVAKFWSDKVAPELIESAVSQALSLSGGTVVVVGGAEERVFSSERSCPECGRGFFKPDPEDLAFTSKRGRCEECSGRGVKESGAPCKACSGSRLGPVGRNVRINGVSLPELSRLPVNALLGALDDFKLGRHHRALTEPIVAELRGKIETLNKLGLGGLALQRDCRSLSGGELQRLRLAVAMGSPLSGVLYIFDEPSAGLHPVDIERVVAQLRELKQRGNSVIVIEHDIDTICAADYIIDVGPGGGSHGGEIVYAGVLEGIHSCERSLTAAALRGEFDMRHSDDDGERRSNQSQDARQNGGRRSVGAQRSTSPSAQLTLHDCSKNNINDLSLSLPLHTLSVICGVSGAGKSSLLHGIVVDTLSSAPTEKRRWELGGNRITSDEDVARLILVDQKPLGKNSRSTPASYLGIWDEIRKLFAASIEAKTHGWTQSFFSYNSGKGRCKECQGLGVLKLEMSFLAEAEMLCEACRGGRFSEEAETVLYQGLSPSQVLALTFEEAWKRFVHHKRIAAMLHQSCDLGLGYLTLGQSSSTLSGGESQRLKLVAELGSKRRDHTIYVLDEPTTGLHKADVARLIRVLNALVAQGHTVFVIENDEQVIRAAGHVVEMGPGSGTEGGRVIFEGAPSHLSQKSTPWGLILKRPISDNAGALCLPTTLTHQAKMSLP